MLYGVPYQSESNDGLIRRTVTFAADRSSREGRGCRPSAGAGGSRCAGQILPVVEVGGEDSLSDGLETVDVPDRLERGDGRGVRLSESLGPLTKQEPPCLLQSSIINDSSIRRRLVHGLNPLRKRKRQIVGIAQPHQQV